MRNINPDRSSPDDDSAPTPPNKYKTQRSSEQTDICSSNVESMTPTTPATPDSAQVEENGETDTNYVLPKLTEGELNALMAGVIERPPSPPISPGPISPIIVNAELRTFFSPIDVGNEADSERGNLKKKPRRGNRRSAGYSGVRKTRAKKKQVHFKDPLFEIRLIDGQGPVALDVDVTAPSAPASDEPEQRQTRASASRSSEPPAGHVQVQPIRGVRWSGFGTNHVPRHYPAIRDREKAEKAKEAELDKQHNKAHDPEKDPQVVIYLEDHKTGLEFTVPRSCLPADSESAFQIDAAAAANPGVKITMQIFNGTPAGVFLYAHVMIFRKIMPYHAQMAWAGLVKIHEELRAESWMSFLLSGLVVAREQEDGWFEGLVVDEMVTFTGEALSVDAGKGAAEGEGWG